MIDQRLKQLRVAMAAAELDAFLSLKLVNTYYLSGLTSLDTARPTSYVRPIAVVVDHQSACLIVPSVADEAARTTAAINDVRVYSTSPVRSASRSLVLDRLKEIDARQIGVEEDSVTADWLVECQRALPQAEFRFAGNLLEQLRLRKDQAELGTLRRAAALTDLAIDASLTASVAGKTELDADTAGMLALRQAASDAGEATTVDAITAVMSGPRGSMPHELTTSRVFQDGELTWHAWIVSYQGYWVENVRTGVVGGMRGRFTALYDRVKESLLAGQETARPGTPAADVFDAVMAVLTKSQRSDELVMSRSGHGVGLEYHEPPFIETSDKTLLEPDMVLTVEPGLWLPGIGGVTLSNTIVIGENNNEVLTQASLEPR